MSNADVIDDDRRKSLDEFARVPSATRNNLPQATYAAPAERVFGAVNVAVQRDETRIFQKLKALAAAAGEDWYYRFPVKKKGGGQDWIEGASIKLANDVARTYGNCDVDCRSTDLGDSWLFLARFTDFETGYTLTRPFQQRKSQSALKTDNDRALDIAFQIGASKAIRNVVVNALQTFADFAFNEARRSLVNEIGRNLDGWRKRTIEGLANIPVDLGRVEAVVGRAAKDWLAPDIARIIAMMKSIADGMATVDETFPAPDKRVDEPNEEKEKTASPATQPDADAAGGDEDADADSDHEADEARQAAATAAAAEKQQAKAAKKADGNASQAATAPAAPTNEAEWKAYCDTWIGNVTVGQNALDRWKSEKTIRNKCNVSEGAREEVKKILDQRVAELNAAAAAG